jgi:adenylate cyclase class 2
MAIELEAKLKVDDFAPVRVALREQSAELLGAVHEVNHILDRPNDPLGPRGMALRVRGVRVVTGREVAATLTFKGPATETRFKSREELEVAVTDADQTLAILTAVGFTVELLYEKRRESWRLGDCLIELDEVPVLGRFVEIEGPSVARIEEVRSVLGLTEAGNIRRGYVAMLLEHCVAAKVTDRRMRFAD